MLEDIQYSEESSPCVYEGRNGLGKQKGISIMLLAKKDKISLTPINSKGWSNAASLEVPIEHVQALINALEQIKQNIK